MVPGHGIGGGGIFERPIARAGARAPERKRVRDGDAARELQIGAVGDADAAGAERVIRLQGQTARLD